MKNFICLIVVLFFYPFNYAFTKCDTDQRIPYDNPEDLLEVDPSSLKISFYDEKLEIIRSYCYVLDSSLDRDVMGHASQQKIQFTVHYARTCYHSGHQINKTIWNYWEKNQSCFFSP